MKSRAAAFIVIVATVLAARTCLGSRRSDSGEARRVTAPGDRAPRSNEKPVASTPNSPPSEDPAAVFRRAVRSARAHAWVSPGEIPAALAPERLGAWDDFKVGAPSVIQEGDRYRLWFRGCRFDGAEYACAVGHAISKDGIVWDRSAGPVFVPPETFEREHLDSIVVARGAGGYVLWYSVAPGWFSGRRRAVLRVARSADGLAWTLLPAPAYEAVALAARLVPAAAWDGTRFHVWLIDSRSAIDPTTGLFPEMLPDGDEMLLHFVSSDGTGLQPAGGTPIRPLEMDPGVLSVAFLGSGGFRAVLYEQQPLRANPQGVASLRSPDGASWTRATAEAMPLGARDLGVNVVPLSLTVVPVSDGALAWFAVRHDTGGESIRVALHKEKA